MVQQHDEKHKNTSAEEENQKEDERVPEAVGTKKANAVTQADESLRRASAFVW
jgi:hypothetical protein